MADPWFEPAWKFGAYFGAIGGTLGGLAGGVLGCCSYFVAKGQGRRWVLGGYAAMCLVGLLSLFVGLYALAVGQPYAIWYPLTQFGVVMGLLGGCLYPVIAAKYREAEQRKIDAAGLRGG